MGYIIVWRASLIDPHVDRTYNHFLETYSSYENAKEAAEEMYDKDDKWYCDYSIFQEVTS